jgi:hypothetical protein
MFNRGSVAGAAPMPDRAAFKRIRSPFRLGQFEFGPGTGFNFQGTDHPWEEAFIGGGLSKGPGSIGCYYDHEDRRTIWILFDAGCWYVAIVEAAAIPKIAKPPEPEKPAQPEDEAIVYTALGECYEDPVIQARPGGFFVVAGREFSAAEDVYFRCPFTGVETWVKDAVVAVRSGNITRYLKYAGPNLLQRLLLRHPRGWYWLGVASGKRTRFNSWGCRAFWHPASPVVILVLSVLLIYLSPMCLMIWPFLVAPMVWTMLYHPARLHLPRAFFDDGAERFFHAKRVHKAVKAAEFTFFNYYFGDSQQQR